MDWVFSRLPPDVGAAQFISSLSVRAARPPLIQGHELLPALNQAAVMAAAVSED
jgi:hypothetical protein